MTVYVEHSDDRGQYSLTTEFLRDFQELENIVEEYAASGLTIYKLTIYSL